MKQRGEKKSNFIIVAGGIGTGKTSLTRLLGLHLDWLTGYESVDDNPYLAQFYNDMPTWVFHLGIFFLGSRAKQHQALASAGRTAVLDRSIYEDAYVFIPALRDMGVFSERDYQTYHMLWRLVTENLPPPDLLIYLQASTEILLERIRKRARPIERDVTIEYLNLLDSYYAKWIGDFNLSPILTIDTSKVDYVHNPEHLNSIVQLISDKLDVERR